jgi:hypothetical protein
VHKTEALAVAPEAAEDGVALEAVVVTLVEVPQITTLTQIAVADLLLLETAQVVLQT